MNEIILVVWGRTDWSDAGRLEGVTDLPLNAAGRSEVVALAERLRQSAPDEIHHGPEEAARETARLLGAGLDLRPKRATKNLQEVNLGLWQGLRREEIEERFTSAYDEWRAHPETVSLPEGEAMAHAMDRLHTAAMKCIKRKEGKRIMLVVGPMASAILRSTLGDGTMSMFWEFLDAGERVTCLTYPPTPGPAEPVAVDSAADSVAASSVAESAPADKRRKNQRLHVEQGMQQDRGNQRPGTGINESQYDAKKG